ncbi:MAG TPA: beta-propeller domain-containing protein [Longimicrobium sp.]|nr:beta-propeller domain-containing protein [Longimicrobium sp.]
MRNARLLTAAAVICGAALLPAAGLAQDQPRRTLRPFENDSAFVRFNRQLQRELAEIRRREGPPPSPTMVPPPPPSPEAQGGAGESITNVQHAGVDEGGIVKVHGDYLVILRRGRLFTVRIGGNALQPVSAVDAFGPGIDPRGAWYDELLVSGDRVVVIGYSYQRGGTEIGLFRIDPGGRLAHRGTWQLRSADYYSSRNYASRLVGGKLVFYAPLPIRLGRDPFENFPAFRRWDGDGRGTWRRTAAATRVYRPAGELSAQGALALHTVTVCGMEGDELDCRSTAVYGPHGRVFYVSPRSVYVWTTQFPRGEAGRDKPRSVVYRLPLDGSAPTGLRTAGAPIDQMSFMESGDGHLNVLVRSEGRGEGMWGAERTSGTLALLRVPLSRFGDGGDAAQPGHYRPLPAPTGYSLQNRYVGSWLLYGAGSGWGRARAESGSVFAVRWAGGGDAAALALPHVVDRIEAMGSGAVVVGTGGSDLHFTGVRLGRASATLADRYVRPDASQGETRTHGFFYRADGDEVGVLGLPVTGPNRPGYQQLRHGSAAVLFLRNRAFRLSEAGELDASDASAGDDGCRASCVDWYGNARPIFLRGRVFALLGYELVEGREDDGRIREHRRVSFAPRAEPAGR